MSVCCSPDGVTRPEGHHAITMQASTIPKKRRLGWHGGSGARGSRGPHDQLLDLHQTLRAMPMRSGGKREYNAQGDIWCTWISCSFSNNYARTACRFNHSVSRRDSRTRFRMSTRLLHPCRLCGNGYGGWPRSRPRTWVTFSKVCQGKDRCRKGRNPFLCRKGGYVFQV